MDWVILVAVLVSLTASLYTAWTSYVSRHDAATSARIAKHAAKEARTERKVASNAARVAVAASGTKDPGTALDPERISGTPDEPLPKRGAAEAAGSSVVIASSISPSPVPRVPQELAYPEWNLSAEDIARHNDEVAGVDPTKSGARSWPTESAPEGPSRNGGDDLTTEPLDLSGTGGGDTSPDSPSGEKAGAARLSLRRPSSGTSSSSSNETGGDSE